MTTFEKNSIDDPISKGSTESALKINPHVTVITVVLNGKNNLEKTILSVLNQTFKNIEYIIIDGGSTDGTLEIIRKYEKEISCWISEPDRGISDAFNKGIALAHGEFIQLVNSDDWLSENQIETGVRNLISEKDVDFIFGDMRMYGPDQSCMFLYRGDADYKYKIRSGMPYINHPTVLASAEIYKKIGTYNVEYKCAMDYDWLLRAHLAGFKGKHCCDIIGNMSVSGVSDINFRRAYFEVCAISIKHGYPPFRAKLLYFYRLFRTSIRRYLEKTVNMKFVLALRRIINPLLK